MHSSAEFSDGSQVGPDPDATSAAPRRTSNAFGAPGTDSTVHRIDLNEQLIRHPEATFVVRAAGAAMTAAGISDGDVLLVDRSLTPSGGNVVIAIVDGEFLCRRLELAAGRNRGEHVARLVADEGIAPITITEDVPLEVWGVVSTVIKNML